MKSEQIECKCATGQKNNDNELFIFDRSIDRFESNAYTDKQSTKISTCHQLLHSLALNTASE